MKMKILVLLLSSFCYVFLVSIYPNDSILLLMIGDEQRRVGHSFIIWFVVAVIASGCLGWFLSLQGNDV